MKQQFRGVVNRVRVHLQLLRTRRAGNDTRQRAIAWLQERQQRPPSHVPQDGQEADMPGPPQQARPRRKGPVPDTIGAMLASDAASQRAAEQLWWKFTQYYLPAKRLDLEQRRGQADGMEQGG